MILKYNQMLTLFACVLIQICGAQTMFIKDKVLSMDLNSQILNNLIHRGGRGSIRMHTLNAL